MVRSRISQKLDGGLTWRTICISKRLMVNIKFLTRCLWWYKGLLRPFHDLVCVCKIRLNNKIVIIQG